MSKSFTVCILAVWTKKGETCETIWLWRGATRLILLCLRRLSCSVVSSLFSRMTARVCSVHLILHCPSHPSSQDINPEYIAAVKEGWSKLTSTRNYEKEAGSILFQK